eukprot:2562293-Rhodomonas_salina.1
MASRWQAPCWYSLVSAYGFLYNSYTIKHLQLPPYEPTVTFQTLATWKSTLETAFLGEFGPQQPRTLFFRRSGPAGTQDLKPCDLKS